METPQKVFYCPECGSTEVYIRIWFDPNDQDLTDADKVYLLGCRDGAGHCLNCPGNRVEYGFIPDHLEKASGDDV